MTLTNGCNHVALVTDDLDRLVDFYVEVFDAEVPWTMTEGSLRHAMIELGAGFALHPFEFADGNPHGSGSPAVFDRGHLDHFALDVTDAGVFETLRDRLVSSGASDGTVTDFGAIRTVWFEDPDGHGGEIAMWADTDPRAFDDRIVETYTASTASEHPTSDAAATSSSATAASVRSVASIRERGLRAWAAELLCDPGLTAALRPLRAFSAGLVR